MVFYIVKKKRLHFHLLSNFPTFVQKSGCSLKKKKKVFSSQISQLSSKIKVFSKKKKKEKVFTSICSQISHFVKNQDVL